MTQEEVIENFSYLTDWEDKYRYLIELGESLPGLSEIDKTPANKVNGCMSQVWITHETSDDKHHFAMDSDAHIVRGLEAILLALVNNKTSDEIRTIDIPGIFEQLGLNEHLSPTRRNGFASMVDRIHSMIG